MTITINVCGSRFVTTLETVGSKPDTKLANECLEDNKEYFFDRNAEFFACVLDYYRTGELHMPTNACARAFKNELTFWGINGASEISVCCIERFNGGDFEQFEKYFGPGQSGTQHVHVFPSSEAKQKIYRVFEDPYSSKLAKVPVAMHVLATLVVVLSVVVDLTTVSIELKQLKHGNDTRSHGLVYWNHNLVALEIAHLLSVCYVCFDFVIRFVCCPFSKLNFLISPFNLLDIAVIPCLIFGMLDFFVDVGSVSAIEFISVVQLLLVIRLLKYFRHYTTVKVMYLTFKSSVGSIALYIFLFVFFALFFASFVLVCEFQDPEDGFHTGFLSVFNSMWWAAVTMTTVGYGDMTPATTLGKFLASLCAVTGLILIALVFSIVNSNFSTYLTYSRRYSHRKATMNSREMGSAGTIERVTLLTSEEGNAD